LLRPRLAFLCSPPFRLALVGDRAHPEHLGERHTLLFPTGDLRAAFFFGSEPTRIRQSASAQHALLELAPQARELLGEIVEDYPHCPPERLPRSNSLSLELFQRFGRRAASPFGDPRVRLVQLVEEIEGVRDQEVELVILVAVERERSLSVQHPRSFAHLLE